MLFRHKRTGGTYRLVAEGRVQTSVPLVDYDRIVVYRPTEAPADEEVWVRRYDEFWDGRFEYVSSRPSVREMVDLAVRVWAVVATVFIVVWS